MDIRLELIKTKDKQNIAKRIVESNHSYVPTWRSVGRRIDYLIYLDSKVVGVIGIGSATYPPCKDMLRYMGITKSEYKDIFNSIANNWRYCLIANEKNLGSAVLAKLRKRCVYDWKERFGDDLKYLVTFVGGGHDGAVYKADNWELIGETAGLPDHKSVSMKWDDGEGLKQKFVKPTGENKKLIFFKKLKYQNVRLDEEPSLW